MITDKTLDEALVEAHRFIKAAKALRAKRKAEQGVKICRAVKCSVVNPVEAKVCEACGWHAFYAETRVDTREHAACKRASLDLTRKLADLRQGR